jgi:hypothetical protein
MLEGTIDVYNSRWLAAKITLDTREKLSGVIELVN